jgi:hypothetical protein
LLSSPSSEIAPEIFESDRRSDVSRPEVVGEEAGEEGVYKLDTGVEPEATGVDGYAVGVEVEPAGVEDNTELEPEGGPLGL